MKIKSQKTDPERNRITIHGRGQFGHLVNGDAMMSWSDEDKRIYYFEFDKADLPGLRKLVKNLSKPKEKSK